MLKPHSKDSVKTKVYASAVFLEHDDLFNRGSSSAGLLNIYRSHTIPHFNFSYGVLGFAGRYKEQTDIPLQFNHKSFNGFGFNGSTSYYTSTRKADWRLIGVDLVYTHESGNYLNYRRSIAGNVDVASSTQAGMFSYGIFSEVLIRQTTNFNFGFKLFVNKMTGRLVEKDDIRNTYGTTSSGGTVLFGYKMFTGYISSAASGDYSGGSVQVGLGYRF